MIVCFKKSEKIVVKPSLVPTPYLSKLQIVLTTHNDFLMNKIMLKGTMYTFFCLNFKSNLIIEFLMEKNHSKFNLFRLMFKSLKITSRKSYSLNASQQYKYMPLFSNNKYFDFDFMKFSMKKMFNIHYSKTQHSWLQHFTTISYL